LSTCCAAGLPLESGLTSSPALRAASAFLTTTASATSVLRTVVAGAMNLYFQNSLVDLHHL